jgi:hypothetical protein
LEGLVKREFDEEKLEEEYQFNREVLEKEYRHNTDKGRKSKGIGKAEEGMEGKTYDYKS